MKTDELLENLLVATFNCAYTNTYSLLSLLEKNIRHPIRIIKYFQEAEYHTFKYALFHSRLAYYNTDLFLIKNFYLKEKQEKNLLNQNVFGIEYLVKLQPPKMYILLIYSDEIKTIEEVGNFIKADKLSIQLSPLRSKKMKQSLHQSVGIYISD
ncbi:MAG: hypothetical protein KatS3mg028_0333 [Bacteroidia bacterium]|nr:MAG: hypothetical protein KatS3mg028_0333 [Bacteroidia bacterium]